jgi:hypothetical protein
MSVYSKKYNGFIQIEEISSQCWPVFLIAYKTIVGINKSMGRFRVSY